MAVRVRPPTARTVPPDTPAATPKSGKSTHKASRPVFRIEDWHATCKLASLFMVLIVSRRHAV